MKNKITTTENCKHTSSNVPTPKEKAWELFNYYGTLLNRYDKAAELSIRVVTEIHNFMRTDDEQNNTCYWANHKMSNYWCAVETELKNLKSSN